jgi:hypothetical protein
MHRIFGILAWIYGVAVLIGPLIRLRMASSGMLRRVALVRTHVSEELSASFIRVTRISELETTLATTSNRRTLRRIPNFFAAWTKLMFTSETSGTTGT